MERSETRKTNYRKALDEAVVSLACHPQYLRNRPWEHEKTWVLERVLASRRADVEKIEYILECRKGMKGEQQ